MKVLVTGGTGFVGSYLCDELARRGHEVTALARNPREADFDRDVETVRGDVTDYDAIEPHFEGQDAVVQLVALSPLFKPDGGDDVHFDVHLGGTENAVEAAEAHGVERFVQMSALGADPDGPTAYIRSKGQAEDAVKASTMDWVIFRPSVVFGDGGEFVPFTRKLATPYLTPLPGSGKTRFQPVFVKELVRMLADGVEGTRTGPHADGEAEAVATDGGEDEADDGNEAESEAADDGNEAAGEEAETADDEAPDDAVDEDPHVGRTYDIGGPEVLTLAQVAELAWAAKRKPVSVLPVPMPLAGIGLSLLDAVPGAPMGSDQYRSLKFDNTTSNNGIGAFGWEESDLTTLQSYLGVPDERLERS
ncbi:complex I NDUFA9 subunit family protein [Halosegnis marinus]|uniref:Complex I NDUFA9 subunit family protein n=1 Tax=Halosegnis marinus TaxID=3034023 RepID=A0ABD5ZLL6_9EURY|nr:complex I NDUFA9 subunit family protein [Halosegnis sp. DT85]